MAVLGTLLLVFIVTHMANFWAKMHFEEMPLQTVAINIEGQPEPVMIYKTVGGQPIEVAAVQGGALKIEGTTFYQGGTDLVVAEGYKDLHKITVEFFQDEKTGLISTILYVVAMIVLGFHLSHGFASAFQSLGVNNPKINGVIKFGGYLFSYLVPALFAIIPLYIHFVK